MDRELSPQELDELLGAHALDAIDGDEREQVERWVERSPSAAQELASLRETAALLAHAGGDAPEGVWSRIEESLSAEPPKLAMPTRDVIPLDERRRRRAFLRIGAGIAAASAAAAAITAVAVVETTDPDMPLAEMATGMDNARTVRLTSSDDEMTATILTMPDGAGFFMSEDLPRLEQGRTYQLWALTGDPDEPDMVSAGVLGPAVEVVAFHGPEDAMGFAVSEEDASGAAQPSDDLMLKGRFA
jgi:hypothetical protein